jgi:hypothetical protein
MLRLIAIIFCEHSDRSFDYGRVKAVLLLLLVCGDQKSAAWAEITQEAILKPLKLPQLGAALSALFAQVAKLLPVIDPAHFCKSLKERSQSWLFFPCPDARNPRALAGNLPCQRPTPPFPKLPSLLRVPPCR